MRDGDGGKNKTKANIWPLEKQGKTPAGERVGGSAGWRLGFPELIS
jgi:hypothetical protein